MFVVYSGFLILHSSAYLRLRIPNNERRHPEDRRGAPLASTRSVLFFLRITPSSHYSYDLATPANCIFGRLPPSSRVDCLSLQENKTTKGLELLILL